MNGATTVATVKLASAQYFCYNQTVKLILLKLKNYFKKSFYWIIFISTFLFLFLLPSSVKAAAVSTVFDDSYLHNSIYKIEKLFSSPDTDPKTQKYSELLKLKSILVNPPQGQEEYFELINFGDVEIDISGWKVRTASGSYIFGKKIIPQNSSITFYRSESSLRFNNNGGFLKLFDPEGILKDEVIFKSSKIGVLCIVKEKVCQSELELTAKTGIELTISIREVKDLKSGQIVKFKGTVTSNPGSLNKHYFYIQDDTSGIQIYSYWADFPELMEGDVIQIEGEISVFSNEKRIKIKSKDQIKKIGKADPISPENLLIEEISKAKEGSYVTVSGRVISKKADMIKIEQNGKTINLTFREETKISIKKIKKGDLIEVSGIVYPDKDFYKILPFESKNVKIITSNSKKTRLPRSGPDSILYLTSFILWNIYQLAKKKRARSPRLS